MRYYPRFHLVLTVKVKLPGVKYKGFDQQVSSVFILHTWKFHFHSQDQIESRTLSQLFSGFHTKSHDILLILVKFLQVLET